MDARDRDLVARVLRGDRASFDVLVHRTTPALWATLRAALGDAESAGEVLQETWLSAFERLGSLRDSRRLRSWLLAIALNHARDRARRRAAARDAGVEPADLEAPGACAPDAPWAARERGTRLWVEVARLPPRQREVLTLRIHQGLSHAEIARLLAIREDASRASYHLAIAALRRRLEPPAPSSSP